ncbi:type IV pilus biosynthesis protein PilQ [Candidatus Glomeribacter gigasporarum BEG34]|uniref:Type IV pilus biosynthesis protein PilQ n=1 Tax=Candidatus Glomeribacter gigasporarum BEG34 TaxID=1070319 RepID=G2J7P6_9BURK|nr:ATPase, T2SS/T4P/T4SS family [Candidatus Glomeribacter gigasporarum]CCD28791.1 type IV pilus biosynthesis protein PilQ [Candidatus Glomeribacter gigasporarum BEG34]
MKRIDATTAPPQPYKHTVPEAVRGKAALRADGTLLIGASYQHDHAVRAYQQLLRRHRVTFTPRLASIEQLKQTHADAGVPSHAPRADVSSRQLQIIDLIKEAVKEGASDLHFLNEEHSTWIKMRVHGILRDKKELDPEEGQALCRCMYESMTDIGDGNYNDRLMQDARLARRFLSAAGLTGARISTRPLEYGNFVALRLLYGALKTQQTLASLGYNAAQAALIQRMLQCRGVHLFSGVTGSGKSTSLQVALSLLLQRHEGRINLMTIEQPLEYVIPGAVQTPLLCDLDDPRAVSEAWSRAISNLMRLDPDVMMVGELRDLPSAVAAIQAALTGHGLWTTTHAKGAFASLDRLADLGVAPRRLGDASLFTGLINQALAPTLCSACKRPCAEHIHEIEDDLRARIEAFTNVKKVYLRGTRPDCPACGGMGVTGRTVVAEIVLTAQPLMDIYRAEAGGSAAAKSYWVKQMKGITKCRHLIEKINQGWIDPKMGEEAVCSLAEDTFTLQ